MQEHKVEMSYGVDGDPTVQPGIARDDEYNIFVRIIRGEEIDRLPLSQLEEAGMSVRNTQMLKEMYNVVLEERGIITLLIPITERKSQEELELQQLLKAEKQLQKRITSTREAIQKRKIDQEREDALAKQEHRGSVPGDVPDETPVANSKEKNHPQQRSSPLVDSRLRERVQTGEEVSSAAIIAPPSQRPKGTR